MKTIIPFILLISIPLIHASSFQQANEAYQNKDFPQAIKLYKESLQAFQSLEQHYNLANAYFENKEYAPALLHYQKALIFAPQNPDILRNLNLANEALNIHPKKPSVIEIFAHLLPAHTWSWIYIGALSLALILLILSLFLSKKLWIQFPFWTFTSLIITCLALHFFYHNKLQSALVLTDNAPLRISATSTSPSITQLPQGSPIKVIKTNHNSPQWTFAKTNKNQEGWLSKEDFNLIW